MGSELHIIAVGGTPEQCAATQDHLEHLESLWSRFITTSDITRINNAVGAPVYVDDATVTLIATMIEAWFVTAGRYDPSILPALVAAGYAASRFDAAQRTILPEFGPPTGSLAEVRVDAETGRVVVPRGVALDPGGIGKGLAADLAVRDLLANGAAGALVSIGGDLAMGGTATHPSGWLVAVEHADPMDGILCNLAVSGGGVATSSTTSRRWVHDHVERHHVIDPGTRLQSNTDLSSVTVIAPTGWAAEAHATAALLAGSSGVLDHLRRFGLSGLAITHDGDPLLTDDLTDVVLRPREGVR